MKASPEDDIDLPTFNQEIKSIEKVIDNYDFFTIKTHFDKAKLPLNKEYIKAKMLYYDKAVLQSDPPKPVLIKNLVGTKAEYPDLMAT